MAWCWCEWVLVEEWGVFDGCRHGLKFVFVLVLNEEFLVSVGGLGLY